MNFTSLSFLPFVFVVAVLYFTVFYVIKKQWIGLLFASIAFYLFSGPKYIVYVATTTVTTYFFARLLQYYHDTEKEEASAEGISKDEKKIIKKKYTSKRKIVLLLNLFINIGLLCIRKYTDFALSLIIPLANKLGGNFGMKQFNFILPLGISFYTFMLIGYFLDVYWKRYKAETNIFKLATFTIYFPHILQGPISRYNKLGPQLFESHKFDYDRVTKGLQLMLWGYFEKMVIADRISIFANGVYAKWETQAALPLIIAIIFFSMKLYLDFQGCMDIGRGISQMFGIDLELNFWHPYFSKTMPEFWRRWHITLGAWFKDYLLYPVSMSKLSKTINKYTRRKWGNEVSRSIATVIPAACVWIVTGTWHGAAMCYVIWGVYHGILIISGSLFEIPIRKITNKLKINTENFGFVMFQMTRTFILSAIGRIFFVAQEGGFRQALSIIKRTFDFSNFGLHKLWDKSLYEYGLDERNFILSVLLIALVWGISLIQEKKNIVIRDEIAKQNIIIRWVLYLALIYSILIFGIYGTGIDASAFVYGQF